MPTPADVAVSRYDCPQCRRPKGARCVTSSGGATAPHARRFGRGEGWLDAQTVATPAPTPTPTAPSMQPPAGTTLLRDLTRAAGWQSENGGTLTELGETGPGGDPVLRSTLLDGQTGASAGSMASERNDLQGGTVPLGSVRWMIWWERFTQMPDTTEDSWQLIGPCEIHGTSTATQAIVQPQVSASKHRIMNANAGRPEWRWVDLGPIVLGEWHQWKLGIRYANDNTGWMELWRDGVRLLSYTGQPTTIETTPGYWKFGHYRNAAINGASVYDVSGCRVYAG